MSMRDYLTTLAPVWLRGGRFERLLFAIGLGMDAQIENAVQAVWMRFPTVCDESALPVLGAERGKRRGPTESTDGFRRRLQTTWDDAQIIGSDWSVLRETLGNLLSLAPGARIVANRYDYPTSDVTDTKWSSYAAGDDTEQPPEFVETSPGNFDWDSNTPTQGSWGWHRMWMIVDSVGDNAWTEPATWPTADDTPIGSLSGCIGLSCDPEVPRALLATAFENRGAHVELKCLVVNFDEDTFDPEGASVPDGNWGVWALPDEDGVYTATRSDDLRYCEVTP